jgi:hypothetical protein
MDHLTAYNMVQDAHAAGASDEEILQMLLDDGFWVLTALIIRRATLDNVPLETHRVANPPDFKDFLGVPIVVENNDETISITVKGKRNGRSTSK